MNKEKMIKLIPNIFTICNAMCGMIALLVAVFYKTQTSIAIACGLILCGMLLDFCDGFLARKLNAQSPIGKELDSFADAITFGIAPITVCLTLHYMVHNETMWFFEILIATFYVMCAVYRLARYNTTESKGYFEGIPSTLSGGIMALFVLISNYTLAVSDFNNVYTILGYSLALLLGLGMISKFRVNRIGKKKTKETEGSIE